jgi:hypothetical protein
MTPKQLGIWRLRERWHEVRDEPPISGDSGRQDDARTHSRMPIQDRLDLARFHTNPVDCHLIVQAPQKLQLPVWPPPTKVAGAIQDLIGLAAEVVRQEPLFGQIRTIVVAAGDRQAADKDFPRLSRLDRAQVVVDQMDANTGDRASERGLETTLVTRRNHAGR